MHSRTRRQNHRWQVSARADWRCTRRRARLCRSSRAWIGHAAHEASDIERRETCRRWRLPVNMLARRTQLAMAQVGRSADTGGDKNVPGVEGVARQTPAAGGRSALNVRALPPSAFWLKPFCLQLWAHRIVHRFTSDARVAGRRAREISSRRCDRLRHALGPRTHRRRLRRFATEVGRGRKHDSHGRGTRGS